jgi:hypothetical protein
MELAAKIYEYEKFGNIQFRIKDHQEPCQFEFQVLNHFYVRNMSIQRSQNPSLKDYKMLPTGKNTLEFVNKALTAEQDNLDLSVLEQFDQLKRLY